jgi:hypothetical protein
MAEGNGRTPRPQIYARLQLQAPLNINGQDMRDVVVYRPNARAMTEVLDTMRTNVQVERFVEHVCRLTNGNGTEERFQGSELNCIDSADFSAIIGAMSQDADQVVIDSTGDGITAPIIYTCKSPISMNSLDPNSELVEQFEFVARKVGEISEYLDARGETREFYTFMRVFGKPLGVRIPVMTDALIGALDFIDYLAIRRQIIPRFINSRGKWRKESWGGQSITIGLQAPGTS